MSGDADVIVIGAGAGGAVAAKELGELGLEILLLEAGPWDGNKKWKEPNLHRGPISNSPYINSFILGNTMYCFCNPSCLGGSDKKSLASGESKCGRH